jgi:hypothetical protein
MLHVRRHVDVIRFCSVIGSFLLVGCGPGVQSIVACPEDLEPVARSTPVLPVTLHNVFEGYVDVEFELATDGTVQRPRVTTSEWEPLGRSPGEPDGYVDALLLAASQYRYAPQEQQCLGTMHFEIQIED